MFIFLYFNNWLTISHFVQLQTSEKFEAFLSFNMSIVSGVDLTCTYSADFGAEARVEWKFQDLKGSQTYVFYRGELTCE